MRSAEYLGQGDLVDLAVVGEFGGDLQQGQRAADVAIGGRGDQVQRRIVDLELQLAKATPGVVQCTAQRAGDVVDPDRIEHMHAAARQQRGVQLERRVFRGRADEDDDALLDMRQEGVLLGLVETVHLVDEEYGAPALREVAFGFGQGLAYIGQPGHHRRDRLEVGIGVARHQQGQGGLAATGRAPQDHRVDATGFQRATQRLALIEQPRLPDDLVEAARTHALGEGLECFGLGKEPG